MTTLQTVEFVSIYSDYKLTYTTVDQFVKYLSSVPIISADLQLVEYPDAKATPAIRVKGQLYPRFIIKVHEKYPNLNLLEVAQVLNKRKLWWIIAGIMLFKADNSTIVSKKVKEFFEFGMFQLWMNQLAHPILGLPSGNTTTTTVPQSNVHISEVTQSGPTRKDMVIFRNNVQ